MAWFRSLTPLQRRILLIAWLGWVFDIMDAALFNFAKVRMLTDMLGGEANYKLHGPAIEGQIQFVFLLGWSIGGFLFGLLADRWSRTRTMIVTVLIYSVFTGLTGLCQNPGQVAVVRFITALGIGGEWAAGAALVAEAFRNTGRAPAASILQSAAAFGPALAALANVVLARQPWPWLFAVGILPALICAWLRYGVEEPAPVGGVKEKPPLRELFRHPVWGRHVLIATLIGVVGVAGAGTVTYWMPNLVKEMSQGLSPEAVSARTSYITWISHIGTLVGVFLVPWLCERWGRRTTIAAFFTACPLLLFEVLNGDASYLRLLVLSPLVNFLAIGVSAAFVLYFPELFPNRFRATGAGIAYNAGRILQSPMPILTAMAATQLGSVQAGVMISGLFYVVGFVAALMAPETRGKPLPEE